MSIPPSTPYPQSIQEILDEGRRNDEAAHNAPKPHPAQHMLDYHDQVARENNAYDYDPELLAALASQNQQQATPTDAIKFGHDNGLFDHFPDEMVPSADPQQPVRVAQRYDMARDIAKAQGTLYAPGNEENAPPPHVEVRYTLPAKVNVFRSAAEARAAIAPTLRALHDEHGQEFGVKVGEVADGHFELSPIYSSNQPGHIDMELIPDIPNTRTVSELHSHGAVDDPKYLSGQASATDMLRAKGPFSSYFTPIDGPLYRIKDDRNEKPAILPKPPIVFHPEYELDSYQQPNEEAEENR